MERRIVPATSPASAANGLIRAATLPFDDLLKQLGTTAEGLPAEEAEVRLHRFGENRVPQPGGPPLLRRFAEQLTHFFALMLWAAAALAFVGRMPQLGWAIVAVVLVNGVFSFAQEYRADRAARALSALLPETGTVLRDGRKARVPAAGIVPGDVVLLREGDRISADARVLVSEGLKVDNSTLTARRSRSRVTRQSCHRSSPTRSTPRTWSSRGPT